MWKLAIEDDQGSRTVVNLSREQYTIGRAEDNSIRLTERNISRHHARLTRSGDTWSLTDVGSYNGVYVNGVRAGEAQPLAPGDLIQLGDYRLELGDEATLTAAPAALDDGAARSQHLGAQPDRLVMLVGPEPGREYALGKGVAVIGRGEDCDISINHGSVSRVHAAVERFQDGHYEIVDRGSANGLRVNGAELQRALLDARDSIELGDVLLKYIPAGMIYVPGAEEGLRFGVGSEPPSPVFASDIPRGSTSPTLKLVLAVVGLGALLALGVVVFREGGRTTAASSAARPPADDPLRTAREALDRQELDVAHAELQRLAAGPPATRPTALPAVAERWAKAAMARAESLTDVDVKRAQLNQVAQAEFVDSAQRSLASAAAAALGASDVSVTELPSARPKLLVGAGGPASSGPAPITSGLVRRNPFDAPGGRTGAPAAAAPTPDALGDRAQLTARKNQLKALVASGKGTDGDRRMLRALCRQLNDMSCIH